MDFASLYKREAYIEFFRNQFLPDDFEAGDEQVPLSFSRQYTEQVTKIGRSGSLDLNVYEVQHGSENDPRVSLSRESFRLLAEYGQKRALVLFISKAPANYRLSLVTIDLKWEEGKRPTKEYSNPRRYSFFLGPDAKIHTPQQYLLKPGRVKDFDDLKKRFSIEVVNKDFYTRIALLFTKLTGGTRKIGNKTIEFKKGLLEFPSPDDTKRKEFAVRLIGRLVFCWFLKKKCSRQNVPLLPEGLISIDAVDKNKGYYHNILEGLFFEVLNTPVNERGKHFASKPWMVIPFLNGGLFTPHDDDYYPNHEQQRAQFRNMLSVPDDWLRDLLNVFETYNFTIDENTPVDVELAIEPEMLGRIFENLLAEINPETGETARKATGSYYTPRPIVEYMVDESLKQYLITKTKLPEEKISSLLSYSDEDTVLTDAEKDAVLDALDTIKIVDPACGSGAFPMGILQKVLLVLRKIDPDSRKWLGRKLSRIDDAIFKKDLERKLKRETLEYVHKLGIIRDAIYGVDIQPIAVEISKLRCFLSLIVDETIDDMQPNRGVEPLPNLEFKFVCANTLIGLPKAEVAESKKSQSKYGPAEYKGQSLMLEATDEISELKKLRDEYLRSYGNEKKTIEEKFRKVQSKMFEHSLNWNGKETQTSKLSQWDPFSHESNPWFDPEWMFGVKDGFDIVIANPPYQEISNKLDKEYYQKFYKAVLAGHYDLYIFFFKKAFSLTRDKGIISFITSHTYTVYPQFVNLRKWIFEHSAILEITNRVEGIFESAVVDNTIAFLIVGQEKNNFPARFVTKEIVNGNLIDKDLIAVRPNDFDFGTFDLNAIGNLAKFKKFSQNSFPLGDIVESSQGITVYAKVQGEKKDWFRDRIEDCNSKPVIRGKDINRYRLNYSGKYIQYGKWLWCPRDKKYFENEKIFLRQTSDALIGTYVMEPMYCIDSVHSIIKKDGSDYDLKYILAILNSSLGTYLYRLLIFEEAKVFAQVKLTFLRQTPIKKLSLQGQARFSPIVDKILAITKSDDYQDNKSKQAEVKELEKQIDQMVYNLYGLTDEEIAIVEGHNEPD